MFYLCMATINFSYKKTNIIKVKSILMRDKQTQQISTLSELNTILILEYYDYYHDENA